MSKGIEVVFRLGAMLPVAVGALLYNTYAVAQEEVAIFEEIVVTVQRREQSIMDVPVAVSAISGAEIQAAGIKDMWDLQQNVVGLIVGQSQTSTSTNFSIRGVGSTSNNFGVESSVGMYVDGVYRSRQSSLVNDLADIDSVEVARGPQGTLFGKNTASGAIIIRTARPTSERNAFFDVTAGNYGLVRLTAGSNFSFTDDIAMRGTVFMSQRDGYVDDDVLGEDYYNDRERWGARLQLGVNEPGDDFNMRIIADYAEIDERCCVGVSRIDSLVSQQSLATGMPQFGSDAAIVGFGGTVFTDYPYPPGVFPPQFDVRTGVGFEEYLVAYDTPPVSTNEDMGLSAEFNWAVGDSSTLTSITAFRNFNTYDEIDADFSPIPLIARTNDAEIESISQELRLNGEFGDGSSYVVGAYYFGQEIDSETFTGDASGVGTLRDYALFTRPDLVSAIDFVNGVAAQAGAPYLPAGDPLPAGVYALDNVNQDQDGWAVFGQVDWSISDNFMLTFGARYTDETKKISSVYEQTLTAAAPPIDVAALGLLACQSDQPPGCFATLPPPLQQPPNFADPAVYAVFAPFFLDGWGSWLFGPLNPRGDLDDELSDDQTTFTAKASWFPGDTSLVYLSYATGFKSGGTNTDRLPVSFDQIFDAETSESIELGFKGEFGPVQLKLAIYDTSFDDFQANSFTGTGFNLQNAGELSVTGIEIETVWRPTATTEIQFNYAHNEGEYDKFEGGTCWDTYTFHTGIIDPGKGGNPAAEQCDRSGSPLPYNPEDRAFIGFSQELDLSSNLSLILRGEYTYASSQFTDGDLDPFTKQDSVELVNVRAGLNFHNWNSTLTLWGRNITDERWYHGSFDQPLGFDRMNSYPAEPATYGLTYTMHFD